MRWTHAFIPLRQSKSPGTLSIQKKLKKDRKDERKPVPLCIVLRVIRKTVLNKAAQSSHIRGAAWSQRRSLGKRREALTTCDLADQRGAASGADRRRVGSPVPAVQGRRRHPNARLRCGRRTNTGGRQTPRCRMNGSYTRCVESDPVRTQDRPPEGGCAPVRRGAS